MRGILSLPLRLLPFRRWPCSYEKMQRDSLSLPDTRKNRITGACAYGREHNSSRFKTAFTVSIEAAEGVTTGVSAADRVKTIQTAIARDAKPHHLNKPGHVFPLQARKGGVLERDGHTEASVDMTRLAGVDPYGVLCEHKSRRDNGPSARKKLLILLKNTHSQSLR